MGLSLASKVHQNRITDIHIIKMFFLLEFLVVFMHVVELLALSLSSSHSYTTHSLVLLQVVDSNLNFHFNNCTKRFFHYFTREKGLTWVLTIHSHHACRNLSLHFSQNSTCKWEGCCLQVRCQGKEHTPTSNIHRSFLSTPLHCHHWVAKVIGTHLSTEELQQPS